MRVSGKSLLFSFAPLLPAVALAGPILMDQIGPDGSYVTGMAYSSQRFESTEAAYNIASIDDFQVLTPSTQVTRVEAVFSDWNGYIGMGSIQQWAVEFYSSVTAGAANLTGDVASLVFAPGDVTLTSGYGATAMGVLATFDLSRSGVVLGPGTYWLGVVPRMDLRCCGQTGVFESTYAGTPFNFNAHQVNPNGGFIFSGGQFATGVNLAYRVESDMAVPEPSTALLVLTGLGGCLVLRRMRSRPL